MQGTRAFRLLQRELENQGAGGKIGSNETWVPLGGQVFRGGATLRAQSLTRPLVALWAQKLPYLNKFEAPEALDRCIRILVSRRIFLAIVQNRLI